MKHPLKQGEFWLMIAAMIAHSLSTTSWSSYSLAAWLAGMLLIWALYGMCRLEAHRKKGFTWQAMLPAPIRRLLQLRSL